MSVITGQGVTAYPLPDEELSPTSKNAVSNEAVCDGLDELKNTLDDINTYAPNGDILFDLGWQSGAIDGSGNIISSSSSFVSKELTVDDILGYTLIFPNSSAWGYIQRVYWKSDHSFYNGSLRYTETTQIKKDNANMYYLRLVASKDDYKDIHLIYASDFKTLTENTINLVVNRNKETLTDDIKIYRYAEFEQGSITASGALDPSNYRARIKNGNTITLAVGDVVSLGDYEKYEYFWVRFQNGSAVANSGVWLNEDLEIATAGEYSFAVKSHISIYTVCDVIDVGNNFCVYYKGGALQRIFDLEASEYGSMPSYYDSQLGTVVSNVYSALKNAGRDKSAFIFVTDQHTNKVHPPRSPEIIKRLIKDIPMLDTVIGGGDLVSGNANKTLTFNDSLDYQKMMAFLNPKFINVFGNHDKNDGVGASAQFTDAEAYLVLQEQMEKNPFITYGKDFYFYFDSPMEKTRYLCANTGWYKMYVDQLAFMRDALLSTPSGWHIVMITHIIANPNPDPDDPNHNAPTIFGTYVPYYAQRILDLLDAYNARGTGTIDGADSSLEHVGTPISYDFSSCDANVEGVVAGHLHADVTRRTSGGIPILICDTEGTSTYGDYTSTDGTITETAVSVIVFDYVAGKLKMFRVGRGIDITMDLDVT